jgi:hypothetical protein
VLLGNANAGVTQQDRDLIDGNAGQEHFDGKSVSEHMAMATLWGAVRLAEIGDFEEPAISALPVGDKRLGQTVPGPEEVIRIRL